MRARSTLGKPTASSCTMLNLAMKTVLCLLSKLCLAYSKRLKKDVEIPLCFTCRLMIRGACGSGSGGRSRGMDKKHYLINISMFGLSYSALKCNSRLHQGCSVDYLSVFGQPDSARAQRWGRLVR